MSGSRKSLIVTAGPKAFTTFHRSNIGLVISNPSCGMDKCLEFLLSVLSCEGIESLSEESYQLSVNPKRVETAVRSPSTRREGARTGHKLWNCNLRSDKER